MICAIPYTLYQTGTPPALLPCSLPWRSELFTCAEAATRSIRSPRTSAWLFSSRPAASGYQRPPRKYGNHGNKGNIYEIVSMVSYVSILPGHALRAAGDIIWRFDRLSLARHVTRQRPGKETGAACHIHHPERFTVKYILIEKRSQLYACCQPTPPANKVSQTAPAP